MREADPGEDREVPISRSDPVFADPRFRGRRPGAPRDHFAIVPRRTNTDEARVTKPIISADSHVVEPPDCYVGRIDPKFRDRAPVMVHDEKRGDVFRIEGSEQRIPLSLVSAAGKPPEELTPLGAKFEKLHRGGWDPQARIEAQAEDGIAAELLYPSVGMELCNIPDLELKQACMEAYNRWLVEFCEPYPHRLIGLGQAAVRTPEEGIRELEVIRDQGFEG